MHVVPEREVPYTLQSGWGQPEPEVGTVFSVQTQIRKAANEYLKSRISLGNQKSINPTTFLIPTTVAEDCGLLPYETNLYDFIYIDIKRYVS